VGGGESHGGLRRSRARHSACGRLTGEWSWCSVGGSGWGREDERPTGGVDKKRLMVTCAFFTCHLDPPLPIIGSGCFVFLFRNAICKRLLVLRLLRCTSSTTFCFGLLVSSWGIVYPGTQRRSVKGGLVGKVFLIFIN
jgi:hypothetical protein